MADKGAFTVYTATHTMFLTYCKDSAKPCTATYMYTSSTLSAHAIMVAVKLFYCLSTLINDLSGQHIASSWGWTAIINALHSRTARVCKTAPT